MGDVKQSSGKDIFESLTGHDELAIAQRFGHTVTELASSNASMFGRSLAFAAKRREGVGDEEAYTAAMNMPMKDVLALADDDGDDDSDADSGKGEAPAGSGQPPASSLSSVS